MTGYRRSIDGAMMVEVAPHQFVNSISAVALGLIAAGKRVAMLRDDSPAAAKLCAACREIEPQICRGISRDCAGRES